jgi:shikimate dehydrogenase
MFEAPEFQREAPILLKRFAVFGQPIAHSRSPWIHARFAAQTHITLEYSAIEAGVADFAAALAAFEAAGGLGANVTLPLKAEAPRHCQTLSERARRAGVVNTLIRLPGGGWSGDNTDGIGLVHDLATRRRQDIRGRRTLVLGAGGAVQGVLIALLEAGLDSIVIANRTAARADALADRIGEPSRVHTVYWDDLRNAGAFEMVINGTAAGHQREALALPFTLIGKRAVVYDMNYGRAAVDFLAWGRTAGSEHVYDGAGMLVEQAAEAFERWHGVRPDTDPVYAQLRHLLDGA